MVEFEGLASVADVARAQTLRRGGQSALVFDGRAITFAEVDAIVFASPSAFHHLCDEVPMEELERLSERVQFAAIGPTTAKALEGADCRRAPILLSRPEIRRRCQGPESAARRRSLVKASRPTD